MTDFTFRPAVVRGKPGQSVRIRLKNAGRVEHNFKIDGQHGADADVQPGKTATVTVKIPMSGSLRFSCEYHKARGMVDRSCHLSRRSRGRGLPVAAPGHPHSLVDELLQEVRVTAERVRRFADATDGPDGELARRLWRDALQDLREAIRAARAGGHRSRAIRIASGQLGDERFAREPGRASAETELAVD